MFVNTGLPNFILNIPFAASVFLLDYVLYNSKSYNYF